ncbi:MAG: DUF4458 domain-containing protein [Bacteroidales bacterium]
MRINLLTRYLYLTAIALLTHVAFSGCSDDDKNGLNINTGFVQFKLYKSGAPENMVTKSASEIDYLYDAKKMEITLKYNGTNISQTLNLHAFNATNAEFGIRSDKLELLAGNYTIIGYVLYNGIDEKILSGMVSENNSFDIVTGGLEVKGFRVEVAERGMVKFQLEKDFSNFGKAKSEAGPSYLFKNVKKADITVQNLFSSEKIVFQNIPMKYSSMVEGNGSSNLTSVSKSDSILYLPAGQYKVISYNIYDSSNALLEANSKISSDKILIEDNILTLASVPVTMYESAEHIKDYFALKKIWESLDGENWSYHGIGYTPGINWDFNKDIDMWGNQPGVSVNAQGRVISLSIGDFAPKGDIPAELGQLTELKILSLGNHNDEVHGNQIPQINGTEEERLLNRMNYAELYLKTDLKATFSEPLQFAFKEAGIEVGAAEPLCAIKKRQSRDVPSGVLSNGITSIPKEIGNLKKLNTLYIANGLITTLPETMSELESLTDFEIYNCPRMTKYPYAINKIPGLALLNMAHNPQLSAQELFNGLDDFARNGASNKSVQILYLSFNNLEEMPASFSNLAKIGLMDLTHNKIQKMHPLGKNVSPVQLLLDNNQISELPVDENGVFCIMDDIETISVGNNKLKSLPNIFDANSIYTIASVNFSFNEIESIDGEADGTYKGIRAETVVLAGNRLKKFPSIIFNVGSLISQFNLSGNQIEEFEKESFYGSNLNMLEVLDLNYNKLSELPKNLDATTVPYLYGIDVSYNRFAEFPYGPLNVSRLTVMAIRYQRTENGDRCLRTWPTGLYTCASLRGFYIGGNDLRKITDKISYMIYMFDISDNPNITIDLSSVCYYIKAGSYKLIYSKGQDIRGCDALDL